MFACKLTKKIEDQADSSVFGTLSESSVFDTESAPCPSALAAFIDIVLSPSVCPFVVSYKHSLHGRHTFSLGTLIVALSCYHTHSLQPVMSSFSDTVASGACSLSL